MMHQAGLCGILTRYLPLPPEAVSGEVVEGAKAPRLRKLFLKGHNFFFLCTRAACRKTHPGLGFYLVQPEATHLSALWASLALYPASRLESASENSFSSF